MITISLCMIVRDEEATLHRCLSSVQDLVEEIIIVDTGSKDRTKEIAESFGAKIYDFVWIDNFAAARNYSFSLATQSHIMWLDADDVIREPDREKLRLLKGELADDVMSVSMQYHLRFDQSGNVVSSLPRNRLVKRSCGFRWSHPVHEVLGVSGRIYHSDIAITHGKVKAHTDRNLQIYLTRKRAGDVFDARDMYYFGNELRDHGRFKEAVEQYEVFLQSKQGWSEDCYGACLKMADCLATIDPGYRQFQAIVRSFLYVPMRAEALCRLGHYFKRATRYKEAIYWYEQATQAPQPEGLVSFVEVANRTWVPFYELSICQEAIGQLAEAARYNRRALQQQPDHPALLQNQARLVDLLEQAHGRGRNR